MGVADDLDAGPVLLVMVMRAPHDQFVEVALGTLLRPAPLGAKRPKSGSLRARGGEWSHYWDESRPTSCARSVVEVIVVIASPRQVPWTSITWGRRPMVDFFGATVPRTVDRPMEEER